MTDGAALPRRLALGLGEGWRRLRFGLRRARRGFRLAVPERLLIAPQELEPGDPITARDIYGGHMVLAGRAVNTRGYSPFLAESPAPAWAEELHGFAWLRHFRDADVPMVRHHARALVAEWLGQKEGAGSPVARLPEVTARRMIAWLINANVLLTDTDHAFYTRFMRALARHAQVLEHQASQRGPGMARLLSAIGYAFYSLSALTGDSEGKRASRLIGAVLGEAVLADGAPLDRNPATALELAGLLIPLRQAYAARSRTPPAELQPAIDRLISFLRGLRHPTGELALVNGMGPSRFDLIGAVLDFDDGGGYRRVAGTENPSGYHRMERDGAVLIADAGWPLPAGVGGAAHAGALAFEFSAGGERLIVNCGAAPRGQPDLFEALRQTAAHSTLGIEGWSSAEFPAVPRSDGALCRPMRAVGVMPAEPVVDDAGEHLTMTSGGYAARFGVSHRRRLTLDGAGHLTGEDMLVSQSGRRRPADMPPAVLRFHLHPRLTAAASAAGDYARIDCPDGTIWLFMVEDGRLSIEDSIYFGGLSTQRVTRQIVVPVAEADVPVRWQLIRHRAG